MPDTTSNGLELSDHAKRVLREALRAIEIYKAEVLVGDISQCPTTDRVRTVAADASAVSSPEQVHIRTCERCRARIRAFQNVTRCNPEYRRDAALQRMITAAPVSSRWVSRADSRARDLFDGLHRLGRVSAPYSQLWTLTYAIACDIHNVRAEGGGDAEVAFSVGASLQAVSAEVDDVLAPWAANLDSAWPIRELLRRAARDVCLSGLVVQDVFARGYAAVLVGAPPPVKVLLLQAINTLGDRSSGSGSLIFRVSDEVRRHDPSAAAALLLDMPTWLIGVETGADISGASAELLPFLSVLKAACDDLHCKAALRLWSSLAEGVSAVLEQMLVRLFRACEPAIVVLQLDIVHRYLAKVVAVVRDADDEFAQKLLRDLYLLLIRRAREERASVFLVVEVLRPLLSHEAIYADMLSELLMEDHPSVRHAVVVALRQGYENSTPQALVPRYARHGGDWVFQGGGSQPLDSLADHLSHLAAIHPDLDESFQWFNARFASPAGSEAHV